MNIDVVKIETIQEMRNLLEESYEIVLSEFLENSQGYITEIGDAVKRSDYRTVSSVAHKIKSSAGNFGFVKMQKISAVIEHFDGDISVLLTMHCELQSAYNKTITFLRENSLLS